MHGVIWKKDWMSAKLTNIWNWAVKKRGGKLWIKWKKRKTRYLSSVYKS